MIGVRTVLAYGALVLALVVTTGTSEDLELDEFELTDEANDVIDLTELEAPDYQELLEKFQRARSVGDAEPLKRAQAAAGWKRAQGASGWKRAQGASGWKRAKGSSGWKRAQGASGWKRAQGAAAGWKRQQASGWKRDSPVAMPEARDGENWRNSNVKSASAGWKRTSRSSDEQQRIEDFNELP